MEVLPKLGLLAGLLLAGAMAGCAADEGEESTDGTMGDQTAGCPDTDGDMLADCPEGRTGAGTNGDTGATGSSY